MEGTADDLSLLFTRELIKVDRISGNADGEVGIILGFVISLKQGFSVKYIDVDVVCLLYEISVENVN